MRIGQWRGERAAACDDLIRRLRRLRDGDTPQLVDANLEAGRLVTEPSPTDDAGYKHPEDLLDALLCARTAAFWHRHGLRRCQVLGAPPPATTPRAVTIIAPARPTPAS